MQNMLPLTTDEGVNKEESDGDDVTSPTSKAPLETGAVLNCGIIEVYSGTAVEGLRSSRTDWQQADAVDGPTTRRGRRANLKQAETRQLGMLDVPDLIESRHSLLSYHWVGIIIYWETESFDRVNILPRSLSIFRFLQLQVLISTY
jgi:hypothetical protein